MASTAYNNYAQRAYFSPTAGDYYESSSHVLSEAELTRELHALGNAETVVLDSLRGWRADTVSFQPDASSSSQDRLVVKQLNIHDRKWTLTAVFDGL
jgi:hypothetical protein